MQTLLGGVGVDEVGEGGPHACEALELERAHYVGVYTEGPEAQVKEDEGTICSSDLKETPSNAVILRVQHQAQRCGGIE